MSHQDQVCKDALKSHAADLYKAFKWLTPAGSFDGIVFRNDCRWSPQTLVFAALLWSWCDLSKLSKRYEQAQRILHWLFPKQQSSVSYQAFMDMLNRWTDRLLACLMPVYREMIQQALADVWRIGNWVVFAVDGSRVRTPRTWRNEARYSPQSKLSRKAQQRRRQRRKLRLKERAREQQANVPQIWTTLLSHVASGLPWAWRWGAADSSERAHLEEMLGTMPADALLTADAGFVGYALWRKILDRKLHLLVRAGSNVRLLKGLGVVKHERDAVFLWPDEAARKSLPPLVLRLIVVCNGKHPVYLLTNLTAGELPDRQAAEIYRQRWKMEVYFRHCKQTYDRTKLRSKNPDNALAELQWSLMSMSLLGLYSHAQLVRQGISPENISFAGVLEAFRDPIREYRFHPAAHETMHALIARALLDHYVRKDKSSRYYPRKKQQRPPGPPTITLATPEQRRKYNQLPPQPQPGLTA